MAGSALGGIGKSLFLVGLFHGLHMCQRIEILVVVATLAVLGDDFIVFCRSVFAIKSLHYFGGV
jgi:hypothetical protein